MSPHHFRNCRAFPLFLPAGARGIWAVLGIAASGWLPALASDPVRVELQPSVEIGESQVRLKDIALIQGGDATVRQRLANLAIGRAPQTGTPALLDQTRLNRWARANLGLEASRITWLGARACRVRVATQEVPSEILETCAREYLEARFREHGLRGEIRVARLPHDLKAPKGEIELSSRAASRDLGRSQISTALTNRRQTVWVDIRVDGTFVRAVPVEFNVSVFTKAYVATQNQRAGKALSPEQLSIREVECTGEHLVPVSPEKNEEPSARPNGFGTPAPSQMPALRLRRPLTEGESVSRSHVVPMPLVARGATVTLRSLQGLIEVETRVEALQDGAAGNWIQVKVPNGTSPVKAQVVGPGLVEIRK